MPVFVRALCLIVHVGMSALIAHGALYQNGPGQLSESFGPFRGRFVWTDSPPERRQMSVYSNLR